MRALALALDFQPVPKEVAHHVPEQAREQAQGYFSSPFCITDPVLPAQLRVPLKVQLLGHP